MRVRELAVRVDTLEKQVSLLLQLPAQVADLTERVAGVESQVLQLRHEMRDGFSAIRSELGSRIEAVDTGLRGELASKTELRDEMASLKTELRGEMASIKTELRGEMASMKTELRGEMASMKTELREDIAALGRETVGLFDAAQRNARILHEEVLDRLKALGERRSGSA
jgi:DNA anti-recombination protein RmuC